MSLDIYLKTDKPQIQKASSGIFVREGGKTKEISVEEWNSKYPDMSIPVLPNDDLQYVETDTVYSDNITHNLNTMAQKAGLYKYLWRPEELNIKKASELINPLRKGLHKLKMNPIKYKKFNPENGWGDYEGLVSFVENYLNACYKYPDANVEASR
jgi:hypothetical protein